MVESKKSAAKQVSIAAFFSPKPTKSKAPATSSTTPPPPAGATSANDSAAAELPALINADAFKTPSPVATVGKRKRTVRTAPSSTSAKKKLATVNGVVDPTPPVETATASAAKKRGRKSSTSPSATAAGTKTKAKAKAKSKAKATPKAKRMAKPAVRLGMSPHEGPGDIDEDDEDDEDDDDDEEEKAAVVEEEEEAKDAVVDDDVVMTEKPVLVAPPLDDAAIEVNNLTIESDLEEQQYAEPKRVTPSVKASKKETATTSTPVTKSKRAVAKKPKDAAATAAVPAPSPTGSPQKVSPPEPVDPVVCARIASYQQKIDELTQICARLTRSKTADDAVLLEIYGLGLDLNLDPVSDEQWGEIQDAWRALNQDVAVPPATATVELPALLKHFVARSIQSQNDSLTELVKRLATALDADVATTAASTLALEMEIKMLAQRTSYGARPSKANLYEDTTPEALWCWEVNNIELHFSDDVQKTIKRLRKQRKRTGAQLKSLSRVVQLLHQSPIDEAKVGNEEVKIGKFVSQVEAELLKAREREKRDDEKSCKEQEKAHAVEEKKRLDHEKQIAKEEEKRRKEVEAEAERQLAEKRRKSLVSYFRSIDTIAETAGTATATVSSVALPVVGGGVAISLKAGRRVPDPEHAEKVANMDREVAYLVKDAAPASTSAMKLASRSGAELLHRQRDLVTAHVGHWCARRYRDEKLGLMKLLQFHENHRPAYHGTFSKRSVVFRRGRRPFAQFAKFDYSVDSEEEWEEEEPGESLSDADSDAYGEDDDDQLDYGDDWLAYEDEVEYVDGEEHRDDDDVVMEEDADGDGEATADHDITASRKRRRRRVAAENKKQKLTKLAPQLTGPFVCGDEECSEHLGWYTGELLEATPEFVSPLMKRAQARKETAAATAAQAKVKAETEANGVAAAVTTTATATPVIKKKAKVMTPALVAATTKPVAMTHKPPVKRKISPQLLSATASSDAQEDSTPSTTTSTAIKKTADKLAANSTAEGATAALRVSPVKCGISGWLKTPAATTTTTAAVELKAETASSGSTKAPVGI